MAGARRAVEPVEAVTDALARGRRKVTAAGGARPAAESFLSMQRFAGNAAVNALIAARLRSPGSAALGDIDGALREIRRDEPAVDTVEKGLKAAKAAGIPVDLEGPKPPPSALAVTKTGFGPEAVPAKKPVPPKKPVPAVSPLGKAAAKAPKVSGKAPAKAPSPAAGGGGGGGGPAPAAAALSGEQLLQPPAPPAHVAPERDPAFTKVTSKVKAFAKAKRAHPPAAAKAKEAQDAALAPTDDLTGQAKAAKADTMDAQQPGTFDKKAFIAAVKAAIEAKSPKNLKEAAAYKESGKAREVKGEVKGLVTQGKEGQTKDVEAATEAPPDQSKAVPKQVTPMAAESPGETAEIPADGAVPKPAPPEQLNLEAGKQAANQEMAEGEVDEQQLAESNEPQFQQALADKKAAAAHADTAPGEYRKQEQETIAQSKAEATDKTAEGVAGMHGAKGAALAKLVADKSRTKSKDEAKRAEVTARIQAIFNATEADVKKILDGIDPKVEKAFEEGETAARTAFESYVSAKMSAYKKDRYGGWLGGIRWAKDKLLGMPSKVNEFYEAGREIYLKQMDGVISRVADIVGGDLTAAKQRIAAGRNEITTYVKTLPANLQKVGAEASKEIGERFEQLEQDVDAKQESVVDTLATKYTEARKGLDDRIEELQAENKGLVDKAIGAIKAVINTIRELVGMLKNVLARAAGVVSQIVKNPIGFLDNLIAGVKGGILKFKDNILDHLRKGLMSWLFGALAEGGVELPETFDLKGILKLLLSLFGLTWRNIRNRLVKQIGEPAMAAIEKGVDIFQKLVSGGVGALWEMLIEKLGDIKEMILEQVKDFVITKIITAGITWLIGLLNPAAAFIKACKLIYDVVMFFVNNAGRIMKFVNTVLDSVADIVRGNIGGVVNKINDVLGQMVPILIGFLASVIGLGGIGQKIREIVEKLQKPVNKALDFVIKTGLKLAGPIIRGLKGIGSKVKAKVAAGKAYVKGKVEAGKQWVKSKVYGGDDSPEGKQKRLAKGMESGVAATNRYAGKTVGERVLRPMLGLIGKRHGLAVLEPIPQNGYWAVHGEVQRMTAPTRAKGDPLPAGHLAPLTPVEENELIAALGNDAIFDLVPTVKPVYLLGLIRGGAPAALIKDFAAKQGAKGLARVEALIPAAATAAGVMREISATPGVPTPVAMDLLELSGKNGWPAARIGPFLAAGAAAGVTAQRDWVDLVWYADQFARVHVGSTDPGGGQAGGTPVGSVQVRWRGNEMAVIELHDVDVQHMAARHTVAGFDFGSVTGNPNSLFDATVTGTTLQNAILDGLRSSKNKEKIKQLILRAASGGDAYALMDTVGAGTGRLSFGVRVVNTGGTWTGRAVNFYPQAGTTNVSTPKIAAIRALIGK